MVSKILTPSKGNNEYAIYFDRDLKSIEGHLTLQRVEGMKAYPIFHRVQARSGQAGYTATNWTRGKSPIPMGSYWLLTDPRVLQMEPRGTRFFPICSDPSNPSLIKGSDWQVRYDIGLHRENQFPGSAGCVVIVNPSTAEKFFDAIEALGVDKVRFYVL